MTQIAASEAAVRTEFDRRVPRWREILHSVTAGRREFVRALASSGLLHEFGPCGSEVHAYHEIELHAFILGIVSTGDPREIQTKSYLTYASHWIDDFFDNPRLVADAGRMLTDRDDIRRALAGMGRPGEVGFAMAERSAHPEAVYRALHRMFYGGLIQRCPDRALRGELLREYRGVSTCLVDRGLAVEIGELQPETYWTTNKTVLELLAAAEAEVDYTHTELWSMIYAPAIFCQDAAQERARGELRFDDDEMPRLEEMVRMIRLGARGVGTSSPNLTLYLQQLAFTVWAIPDLPTAVVGAYEAILAGLCDIGRPAWWTQGRG